MNEREARTAIVAAGRRLGSRGLVAAAEGNLSVRLPGSRLLVTPSGRRKDELRPEELLVVPLDPVDDPAEPHPPGLRPTSDLAIHRAVLRARPDVGAIAHAHLPASMALTVAGERPDPAVLPETAHFLPELPLVPFAAMGSEELAERIAAALVGSGAPGAAILERHGAVAVGDEKLGVTGALAQAVDRLELVEVLCRVWLEALLVRAARSAVGQAQPVRPSRSGSGGDASSTEGGRDGALWRDG